MSRTHYLRSIGSGATFQSTTSALIIEGRATDINSIMYGEIALPHQHYRTQLAFLQYIPKGGRTVQKVVWVNYVYTVQI